ncbi:MAG: hypothetical protein AABZ00_03040 [Chloroflexota bacterium]
MRRGGDFEGCEESGGGRGVIEAGGLSIGASNPSPRIEIHGYTYEAA